MAPKLERRQSSIGNFWREIEKNNAQFDQHDQDEEEKLTFEQFCKLMRERELGAHTLDELQRRFNELDMNGNGVIEMHEFLRFSLQDALAQSADQVRMVFQEWDLDRSGFLTKAEFRSAMKAMGCNYRDKKPLDMLFDEIDVDGSGRIELGELERSLTDATIYGTGFERGEIAAEDPSAAATSAAGVRAQVVAELKSYLQANAARVMDLFRQWDDDGDGRISRRNFRKAMPEIGLKANRSDVDLLFASFDKDNTGFISFGEFNAQLRKKPSGSLQHRPWVAGAVTSSPLLETARELLAMEFSVKPVPTTTVKAPLPTIARSTAGATSNEPRSSALPSPREPSSSRVTSRHGSASSKAGSKSGGKASGGKASGGKASGGGGPGDPMSYSSLFSSHLSNPRQPPPPIEQAHWQWMMPMKGGSWRHQPATMPRRKATLARSGYLPSITEPPMVPRADGS